jgi:hypothetical protein
MAVIAELDVKKDARNRVTLPAASTFAHYLVRLFEDGHVEMYPRVLADPTVSLRTVRDMDAAMTNLAAGKAGAPVDAAALLEALDSHTK